MMYQFILIIVLRPGNRNIPVRRDLDSFDPIPATTIRPALDFDLTFMYDHLLVEREDDGARNGHVLDRESVGILHVMLANL